MAESTSQPICNILTPVGMLGYGLDLPSNAAALNGLIKNNAPTAIILDSGSTDSGPEKLALGHMTAPRSSYVRDLEKLLRLGNEYNVPVIFSSAGGDGTDEHVRELTTIVEEIAAREENAHYKLKTVSIFSDIPKPLLHERLSSNAISGCGAPVPPLTPSDIATAPSIASQMGPEPFLDAMRRTPDFSVLVGGRAYDPAPYVAFAALCSKAAPLEPTSSPEAQRLWGGFTHMGKILECGGHCATPKSTGALATVYADGSFDVAPVDPGARCTTLSVAAHTLYEKSRPDLLYGPGGCLDLRGATYEQCEDGRTVRVRGGMFVFSRDEGLEYRVKLEGAKVVGWRSVFMGSVRDPTLIGQLDDYLETRVKWWVRKQHEGLDGDWEIDFHLYGKDAMSTVPPNEGKPAEVFIMGEVLASSQKLASSVATSARIAMMHGSYPGQKATSGNLAFGLGGKMHIELGPCAQFSIYHLMDLKPGEERLHTESNPQGLYTQLINTFGQGKPRHTDGLKQMDISKSAAPEKTQSTNGVPQKEISSLPITLGDIARVVRSKNAGPFEITFDVIFEKPAVYQLVKDFGVLTTKAIAPLIDIAEEDIIWSGFYDQALAFKATIPRLRKGKVVPNGGFMENDVHASQQYIGLLYMELPHGFASQWEAIIKDSPL